MHNGMDESLPGGRSGHFGVEIRFNTGNAHPLPPKNTPTLLLADQNEITFFLK